MQGVSTNAAKKTNDINNAQRMSSSMAPSDEFLAFWGDNVDPSWFEGKRFLSPFVIVIVLLAILTFYLCGRLLFSPGEVEQIFFESAAQADMGPPVVLDESTIQEEKSVIQNTEISNPTENKAVQPTQPKATPPAVASKPNKVQMATNNKTEKKQNSKQRKSTYF